MHRFLIYAKLRRAFELVIIQLCWHFTLFYQPHTRNQQISSCNRQAQNVWNWLGRLGAIQMASAATRWSIIFRCARYVLNVSSWGLFLNLPLALYETEFSLRLCLLTQFWPSFLSTLFFQLFFLPRSGNFYLDDVYNVSSPLIWHFRECLSLGWQIWDAHSTTGKTCWLQVSMESIVATLWCEALAPEVLKLNVDQGPLPKDDSGNPSGKFLAFFNILLDRKSVV